MSGLFLCKPAPAGDGRANRKPKLKSHLGIFVDFLFFLWYNKNIKNRKDKIDEKYYRGNLSGRITFS